MDTYNPLQNHQHQHQHHQHQPDEGYSEAPLNTMPNQDLELDESPAASLSALKSPADLRAWISANATLLPISLKTGWLPPSHNQACNTETANPRTRTNHGSP